MVDLLDTAVVPIEARDRAKLVPTGAHQRLVRLLVRRRSPLCRLPVGVLMSPGHNVGQVYTTPRQSGQVFLDGDRLGTSNFVAARRQLLVL